MISWDDSPPPLAQLHAEAEALRYFALALKQQDYIDILEWWVRTHCYEIDVAPGVTSA